MLIGARFLQGVGGALTSAVILGMIVTMFPEPREQAKAIGIYSFVASAGASIGLLAGGVLTEAISWHWIFFVNLPIGIATARARAAAARARRGHRLEEGADVLGAAAGHRALMLGVYTIVEAADTAGARRRRSASARSRSRCWAGSSRARRRAANPLVPLRIFRSRNVAGANVVQILMVAGHVRHVLPRRAVPAAGAGLRPDRGRPGVPAGVARHRDRCRSGSRRG